MNEITDAEIDAIRQRTGGAVAEQVNRILGLGPYAVGKARKADKVKPCYVGMLDSHAMGIKPQRINWQALAKREI